MTLKIGLEVRQGHWKYQYSIKPIRSRVTMALSLVISGIFSVEKCRDLEIGVRRHSRSMKVVPFGRKCIVFY